MTAITGGRVPPFGHPGLTGCVRLPPAFRSLPRPSSPLCAQASPTRPLSLDSMIHLVKPSTRTGQRGRSHATRTITREISRRAPRVNVRRRTHRVATARTLLPHFHTRQLSNSAGATRSHTHMVRGRASARIAKVNLS